RIGVTREALRKVRIALPKRALVAIGESRVTDDISAVVAGNAPARQGIAVGMSDGVLARTRIPHEVATVAPFAPGTVGIPMPRLGVQLRILPIADGLPARGQNPLDHGAREQLVGVSVRQDVDAGPKRGPGG